MKFVKDYDTYFEKYMGRIFFRIISKNNLKKVNSVVEFAPGFRFKIAYALKRLNFDGTLYVIDSNRNVLDFVSMKYKKILPNAKIVVINKDLKDSIKELPKEIDLFLANHCIDDMIISKYLSNKELEDAFNNTEDSKQLLINCWNELREEDNKLFNIEQEVLDDMKSLFENIKFKLIVLSQYKSGYYMNQKNYVEDLSRKIFNELNYLIETNDNNLKQAMDFEFDDFDVALNEGFSLKDNIQNSKNWIAGVYKK